MEKKITFKLVGESGSWMVGQNLEDVIAAVFGCNNDGSITEEQVKEIFGDLEDDEEITYKIVIQKKYTQEELDNMPESDGDIH